MNAIVFLLLISYAYGQSIEAISDGSDVGIIGGHAVTIEKAPFLASLRLNGTLHFCGCSIIDERFALTAAHCIIPNRSYKVSVGSDKIHTGGSLYDVEQIFIHQKYNDKTYDFDVALLKLKDTLTFSNTVNKILLNDNSNKMKGGTILTAIGWGYTKPNGNISESLQEASLPKVSRPKCQQNFGKRIEITKRMICAGGNGKDTCKGDSGGPLVWNSVQVGITSFGSDCGRLPGVYTNVFKLLRWIKKTIGQNVGDKNEIRE